MSDSMVHRPKVFTKTYHICSYRFLLNLQGLGILKFDPNFKPFFESELKLHVSNNCDSTSNLKNFINPFESNRISGYLVTYSKMLRSIGAHRWQIISSGRFLRRCQSVHCLIMDIQIIRVVDVHCKKLRKS